MKEERIIYCEAPDCDTHQRTTRPSGSYPPSGWVSTTSFEPHGETRMAFCSWDCVLKFAATIPPREIIPSHHPFGEEE